MQIQVNGDNHIQVDDRLIQYVETVLRHTLDRLSNRITRLEVHLTDENSSQKSFGDDMRCAIEARLAGQKPITVKHQAGKLDQAIDGAVEKLERTLQRTIERLHDPKGRTPATGERET